MNPAYPHELFLKRIGQGEVSMSNGFRLYVVDEVTNRRAAICRMLAEAQIYAEPFDSLGELSAFYPKEGVMLIADRPGQVAALLKFVEQHDRWLPIVCYSQDPSPQQVARAVLDGASGYVAWPFGVPELLDATTQATRNEAGFGRLKARLAQARSRLSRLTKRELQVLNALTDGLSNREIGERLAISVRTVEIHRSNMLHKIGASHTVQALRIAIEASVAAY